MKMKLDPDADLAYVELVPNYDRAQPAETRTSYVEPDRVLRFDFDENGSICGIAISEARRVMKRMASVAVSLESASGSIRESESRSFPVVMTYDREVNAAYIYLVENIGPGEAASTRSSMLEFDQVAIEFDFDKAGFLLGIEILGASQVLPRKALDEATI